MEKYACSIPSSPSSSEYDKTPTPQMYNSPISTFPHFSRASTAAVSDVHARNGEFFIALLSHEAELAGALQYVVRRFTNAGRFSPDDEIRKGLVQLSLLMGEDGADRHEYSSAGSSMWASQSPARELGEENDGRSGSTPCTPRGRSTADTPTRSASGTPHARHSRPSTPTTPTRAPGSLHARRLWALLKSRANLLTTLDPNILPYVSSDPAAFFLPANAHDAGGMSHALEVYTYSRRISTRASVDALRYALVALAWHRVVQHMSGPATPGSRTHRAKRFRSKPRVSARVLDALYDRYFEPLLGAGRSAEPTTSRADVVAWFNGVRTLAAAWAFVAEELGAGALILLIPHVTASQAAAGIAPNTTVCAEGVAWLAAAGVKEKGAVYGGWVEECVRWVWVRIEGNSTMSTSRD